MCSLLRRFPLNIQLSLSLLPISGFSSMPSHYLYNPISISSPLFPSSSPINQNLNMAVQSQFCSENFGFQDWSFLPFSDQFHGVSSSTSVSSSMAFALNSELDSQNREIDFLLQLQNQKLRVALHEHRKRQLMTVLGSLETEASNLMRQKEEDLAVATRTAVELEQRLKKAELETEAWRRAAAAKEAVVVGLHHRLEEARERQVLVGSVADDAESGCDESSEITKLPCKSCRQRNACVVFLPCRHVCSCKLCEGFVGRCPVCETVKEASMEVLLI